MSITLDYTLNQGNNVRGRLCLPMSLPTPLYLSLGESVEALRRVSHWECPPQTHCRETQIFLAVKMHSQAMLGVGERVVGGGQRRAPIKLHCVLVLCRCLIHFGLLQQPEGCHSGSLSQLWDCRILECLFCKSGGGRWIYHRISLDLVVGHMKDQMEDLPQDFLVLLKLAKTYVSVISRHNIAT